MKTQYLTDKEIDEITTAIYNDTLPTLYESISQDVEDSLSRVAIKELFEDKGIEYLKITIPELEDYILTRQARVFNTKTLRYLKPVLTGSTIFANTRGKRIPFKDLFEEEGWTFDLEEVASLYKKNNWKIAIIGKGDIVWNKIRV